MVKALDRKLLRDLGTLRGQVITIALVVACGIAAYATMRSTYASLEHSKNTYYERYRFADVFVHLERAPDSLLTRIEAIDGVATAYARVVKGVMLPVEGMSEPATGTVLSLPPGQQPPLNGIFLRRGRMPEPGRPDEVLVLEAFADAHGIAPGDRLPAVINGNLRRLRVVGIALSPEYVFAMSYGDISSDPKRYGVLWMSRDVLAPAFDMDGAFNDVAIRLQPGASEAAVGADLDRLLEPYGGTGAIGRDRQLSSFALEGELSQLESFATVVPAIFLAVAAFLVNVVLSRLIHLQRPEIAALKALGYADLTIGLHFLKLVAVIVTGGAIIGLAVGAWLGHGMTDLYTEYFKFPVLDYRLDPSVAATAVTVSLVAAVVGAVATVMRVASLPPAEAMRPPAPLTYKKTLAERVGLFRLISPASRMVMREIQRRPLRLLLSSLGISMAVGIMVVGRFGYDSMNSMIDVQFQQAWREDLAVTFLRAVPSRGVRELRHLPGVLHAEGLRALLVRVRNGPRFRETLFTGYPEGSTLRRMLDKDGRPVDLPPDGVILSRKLAEVLGVSPGEQVEVELREGDRSRRWLPVAGLVDDSFGLQGYMRIDALHRLAHEEDLVSIALLRIDPLHIDEIHKRLKEMPLVAAVSRRENAIERFEEQSGEWMVTMTLIMTAFAMVIAVGVVYNNARVALSMRSRDLASLRVLGFTRAEISAILLGEQAVQVLLAVPIGLWVGTLMSHGIAATMDPEVYRLPIVISDRTYAFAVVVTAAAALVSGLLVRRKLDRLDLIGVLKTRE